MLITRLLKDNLLTPFLKKLPERWICFSENDKKLLSLKNIHKGKRAFLIGSGPSLQIGDLDKLQNEITFACNKIYVAFNETNWRPTYYSVIDCMVAHNCAEKIQKLKLEKLFCRELEQDFPGSTDVTWLKHIPSQFIDNKEQFDFSKKIVRGVYGGYTVIYTMLQLAYYMGINEVYLLGLDFNFHTPKPTGEKSRLNEIILEHKDETNHFHPDYRKIGEKWTFPQLDNHYLAFQKAKQVFEDSDRTIYNASRSTKLDIFPLVNFDEII